MGAGARWQDVIRATTRMGRAPLNGSSPDVGAVGYTLDETFDIGWDKGSPVSEEYGPIAKFTGKIVKVDFDSQPDLHPEHDEHRAGAEVTHALIRQ